MSTDTFEDELRALLRDTADAEGAAYVDVAPDAVLVRGRRVVRRRRAVAGVGIAAAAIVCLVGWSALGTGVDRTSTPAGTTSASPHGAVTAVLDTFSGLTDGTSGAELSIPGPRRVAVTVDPSRTPDLVYWDVAENGSRSMLGGSSLVGVDPLAATWGTAGDGSHVVVGVVPEQARAFSLVTPMRDAGGGMSTTVEKVLPGTGRKAFGTQFSDPSDPAAARHLVWWGVDGTVHDETGALLPSVALGDDDGTTVFLAAALDRMGTFAREGGASMMSLDSARNSSGRPVISTARGGAGSLTGLFVAVVPDGTTAGAMVPTKGTTVTRPLAVVDLPDTDRSVVWATYTSADAPGATYSSVTWTEPGGRQITERP